jgi:hypothetical protein
LFHIILLKFQVDFCHAAEGGYAIAFGGPPIH